MATLAVKNMEGDCRVCGKTFLTDSMLHTKVGHVCKECSRNEYISKTKSVRSPHYSKVRITNADSNLEEICNKLFPHPEHFHMRRRRESTVAINSNSTPAISKKPLRCPHLDCGKFISVFDVGAHFRYEHKEIPLIYTNFDARSALEFSPINIKHGLVRTMVVLSLSGFVPAEVPSSTKNSNNLTDVQTSLMVLATKLTDHDLEEKSHDKKIDRNRSHKSNELKDTDKWIFWLGSNISTNISYTIATSSLDNSMRLKYFGPVLHLEESPVKLWRNGRCLPMNRYQIEGMSDNFQKNLNLDIVVYSED